jgi:hypothetical protein
MAENCNMAEGHGYMPSTVRPETGATAYTLRVILWPHCQDTLDRFRDISRISLFLEQSQYYVYFY